MAFDTLATIRTGKLNPELGLDSDVDLRFGRPADRNAALQWAFQELWPVMARLVRETVTPVTNQTEYSLTSIVDVQSFDVLDTNGNVASERNAFRVYADESAATDAPVQRLVLPRGLDTTLTYRVVGYAPYKVPQTDSDTCDLPRDKQWVVVAGARAFLYRRAMNQHITSQRFQNENRSTAESVAELTGMYNVARQEFMDAISRNRRGLVLPKAANLRRKVGGRS